MNNLIKDLNIVLRHVNLAQRVLTEYLQPDCASTPKETISKLLEILDDKSFLKSQQKTEDNLGKLINRKGD